MLLAPFHFSEGTAAGDTFAPEGQGTEASKAGIQPVNLCRQGAVVGLERERKESDRSAGESFENVGREYTTSVTGTRQTEAVVTRRSSQVVLVWWPETLKDVGESSTIAKGEYSGEGLHCSSQCGGYKGSFSPPTRVSECFG